MEQYTQRLGQGTGAITYFFLGWCPSKILITGLVEEDVSEWYLPMLASPDSIETVDSSGIRTLDGTDGISLVKFNDEPGELPGSGGAPSAVECGNWWEANGLKISAGAVVIADGNPYIVEAWRMPYPMVRAIHDAGDASHTYFQDASVDFRDAGVEGNQNWIIINETNDNYAYVKEVQQPAGQSKFCRLTTATDSTGSATTAADFDDDDVAFIVPKNMVQYPLSGVGLMT